MATHIHRGDGGETQLGSGQRVRKDDARIECAGSIDELSSFLGLSRAILVAQEPEPRRPALLELCAWLARIQHELYLLGAELARRDDDGTPPRILPEHVRVLDGELEATDATLPRLRAFILPGGGVAGSHIHVARAICRRVERDAVKLACGEPIGPNVLPYLNRLSLALFSMARLASFLSGHPDENA